MTLVRLTPAAHKTWPAFPAGELSALIDSLFGDVARGGCAVAPTRTSTAAAGRIEFRETQTDYSLTLETPGFPREALKVEVEGEVVTLSGRVEGEQGDAAAGRGFAREFTRRVRLPGKVAGEGHKAVAKDGVLTVTLAKPAPRSAEPQKIEVA